MEHPKQVRHRRRPQNRQGRHAEEDVLQHQTLEINMYVAKAQQDAASTLHELHGQRSLAHQDEEDDEVYVPEELLQQHKQTYYTVCVLPSCPAALWSKLHSQFNHHLTLQKAARQPVAKKGIDFEYLPEAETTCGSGTSDTDNQFFSTDSESKAHLMSCDEFSDADKPSNMQLLQESCGSKGRRSLQVEVRSITETPAISKVESSTTCNSQKSKDALQATPGSWIAQQRLRRSEQRKDEISAEEVGRKALGLLNKLTQERFDVICDQLLELPVCTTEHLAAVVAAIFEKATTERGFLELHATLCSKLDVHFAASTGDIGGKAFRKSLVTECQACFERNMQAPFQPEAVADLSYEDRYEMEVKHKTRSLGNMRFIGQLLVRKLLAAKVFFFIVNEMLDVGNDASLESLAELLHVVAPAFEQKQSIYTAPLREVFAALKKKSKDIKVSTCIRCKLCDLLEARSRNWAPRAVAA
jgi:hypothetical protein